MAKQHDGNVWGNTPEESPSSFQNGNNSRENTPETTAFPSQGGQDPWNNQPQRDNSWAIDPATQAFPVQQAGPYSQQVAPQPQQAAPYPQQAGPQQQQVAPYPQQQQPRQQFPPQATQQMPYQQGYSQPGMAYAPPVIEEYPEQRRFNPWLLILIVLFLAAPIIALSAYYFLVSATDSPGSAAGETTDAAAATASQGLEDEPAMDAQTQEDLDQAQPEAGETISGQASGEDVDDASQRYGSYQAYGPTSEDFAANVYQEFLNEYNGDANITLSNVYSPTTGQTYTMTCSDYGSYVGCSGGNNAYVQIY